MSYWRGSWEIIMCDDNATPFLGGIVVGFLITAGIIAWFGTGLAREQRQEFGKLCVEQNKLSSSTCVNMATGKIEGLEAARMFAIGEEVEKK